MPPMTPPTVDLAAIRERCEKATPGPWQPLSAVAEGGDMSDEYFIKAQPHPAMRGFTKDVAMVEGEPNADFIAHARTDLPALLALADRLEERCAVYKSQVEAGAQRIEAQQQDIDEALQLAGGPSTLKELALATFRQNQRIVEQQREIERKDAALRECAGSYDCESSQEYEDELFRRMRIAASALAAAQPVEDKP